MTNSQDARIHAIDQASLTHILRSALNDDTVVPTEWTCHSIHGGIGHGTAVYRVSGMAENQVGNIDWSVVLKVLNEQPEQKSSSAWFYWKREADFYQSNWVTDLPCDFRSAMCFSVSERVNEAGGVEQWLWLEDVADDQDVPWSLDEHNQVARHLGNFNGAYASGRPLPSESWLNETGIPSVVEHSVPAIGMIQQNKNHPVINYWLRNGLNEEIIQWWHDRELYCEVLRRLPKTLCHYDAVHGNLFLAEQGQNITAIDWSYVGYGPVGAEILPLIIISLFRGGIDIAQAKDLEQAVFDGYLKGLHEAGWQENPDLVRLAYTAAAIYPGIGGTQIILDLILDEERQEKAEQGMNVAIRDIAEQSHQVLGFVAALLQETRELKDKVL